MKQEKVSGELVESYSPWGARRLRLMLKIGLTYEMSHDLEMAELHYRDAKKLAFSLMAAFLPNDAKGLEDYETDKANQLLENINLFYQPLFAEAWAVQKLPSGLDTPVSIVEEGVKFLRRNLPILNDLSITQSEQELRRDAKDKRSAAAATNQQFSIIGAEIHNKAGDLYFFKGRSYVSCDDLAKYISKPHNADGFVLIAHQHYATALHEIRRFNVIRRASSAWKLQIEEGDTLDGAQRETLRKSDWPDFVSLSVVNNLTDLADAAMSRTSLISTLKELHGTVPKSLARILISSDPAETTRDFCRALDVFLESGDDTANSQIVAALSESVPPPPPRIWWSVLGYDPDVAETSEFHLKHEVLLGRFLGKWSNDKGASPISFGRPSDQTHRLYFALHMAHAAAAITERAGYPTNAAAEHLFAAEIAIVYLLRLRVLNVVSIVASGREEGEALHAENRAAASCRL